MHLHPLSRRHLARCLSLATILFAALLPAHAQSTPESTVRQWMAAFNAGDMARAASFNSPAGTSIIDEFSPYAWNGPKAFDDWAASFDANSKATALTEPKVTLGKAIVHNVTATGAYLTFPAVYTYKEKGAPTREAGRIAVVLRKEAGAWKIAAWTWAGTVPTAATAP